jgi:hypothetical protein
MHTLEYKAFRKIPILLLDTEQYQVTHDHFYYWAFATEVYDHLKSEINRIYDDDIQRRLHLIMDLLFMLPRQPDPSAEAQKLHSIAHALLSKLRNVESNSFLILSHLVYLLIEGLGRRMLPLIVDKDGTVLTDIPEFKAQDGGAVRSFAANGKDRINRIGTLLRILECCTGDSQLQNDLKDFRVHFDVVYSQHANQQKAYDVISEFRNTLLHGETL